MKGEFDIDRVTTQTTSKPTWQSDIEKVAALEHALVLSPWDWNSWQEYEACLNRMYGTELPETVWTARQFLICLRNELTDPEPLNDLAAYYQNKGQHFNAMLCRLASLSAAPSQTDVYEAVKHAYNRGILTPSPFVPTEPIECTVSVILATYNRPDLLRHAVSSVLDQTFQDFELLVVNDGGTHEAESVIDSFDSPKIRYFYKEEQGGHRSAMNVGLRAARGKYIAYLDDDDIYFPNHLQTVVETAEKEKLDFVCSRNRWVKGKWRDGCWIEFEDLTEFAPFSVKRLHKSAIIADLTVLHTRALVEKVGLFWKDPPRGGEWEYWVRCSHHVPIRRLDTITGEVRGSTLPATQPARAQFFTELWRIFFGSACGTVSLAAGAWHNEDEEAYCWHMDRIDTQSHYLNQQSFSLLWNIGLVDHGQRGRALLEMLVRAQPARAGLQLQQELISRNRTDTLSQFPLTGYARLGLYLLNNPRSLLNFFRSI